MTSSFWPITHTKEKIDDSDTHAQREEADAIVPHFLSAEQIISAIQNTAHLALLTSMASISTSKRACTVEQKCQGLDLLALEEFTF